MSAVWEKLSTKSTNFHEDYCILRDNSSSSWIITWRIEWTPISMC